MEKNFNIVKENVLDKGLTKDFTIENVDYFILDKTSYSFHIYAWYKDEDENKHVLTELLYDLRNKEYFIKRNNRSVDFNVKNLDTVIPREKMKISGGFYTKQNASRFFTNVSVEDNEEMYETMMKVVGSIGDEVADMSSRALIRLITRYNKLELVYKAGFDLRRIVDSWFLKLMEDAEKRGATKLHQILNMTKRNLKLYRRDYENSVRESKRALKSLSGVDNAIVDKYYSLQDHIKELEEEYNMENMLEEFDSKFFHSLLSWCSQYKHFVLDYSSEDVGGGVTSKLFNVIFEYNHPNYKRLIEYLLFECLVSQGMDFMDAVREYEDYYSMCRDMEYENFDKYPKFLKTYHDIVSMNYREVRDKMVNEKFEKVVSNYDYLEDQINKDFVMVRPETPHDLVKEGNVLRHCIASYVNKVAKEKTIIMFLRQTGCEEDPYISVEIRDGSIVQYRGKGNQLPEDAEEAQNVRDAVKSYAKKKNLKLKAKM